MTGPNDAHGPQDQVRIERWLTDRETRAPRPDRDGVLKASLRLIPTTHQRRRWWFGRWLPHGLGVTRSARSADPDMHRRSRMMIVSTSLTAVVAVGALATAALLAVALPDRGSPFTAGAPLPDASAASTFTGTQLNDADETVPPTSVNQDGVSHRRGQVENGVTVESTDPRFSGEMDFTFNADLYLSQATGAFWGDQEVTNADGSWTGQLIGAGNPLGHWRASTHFVGGGDYEGLVAIVYFDSDLTFEGAIIPGDLPPRE